MMFCPCVMHARMTNDESLCFFAEQSCGGEWMERGEDGFQGVGQLRHVAQSIVAPVGEGGEGEGVGQVQGAQGGGNHEVFGEALQSAIAQ